MRKSVYVLAAAAVLFVGSLALRLAPAQPAAAQSVSVEAFEYIDIRWDEVDTMIVVYPDGRVDFIGKELKKVYQRPEEADQRAFYMTLAINKLAAQGYELGVVISDDEILMRRRSLR